MMYEHYFQSDSSKVVTHKPVNLEISTLSAGLKRRFTIAIKTSEDKIKRRLNKTCPLAEVYLTSENDPAYVTRAAEYAKQQAAQAAAAADGDEKSAPASKAKEAQRNEQLNYIGSKEIFTTHPGGGIVCIKLRAAEQSALPVSGSDGPDADASNDGFLFSVETKGGRSLGRQKQHYILLKRNCIYSLLMPSDILITKIETKDKHNNVVVMKHWISTNAQLANKSTASSAVAASQLLSGLLAGANGISPTGGLPSTGGGLSLTPNIPSPFTPFPSFTSQMAMPNNNISPFHMSIASLSAASSPARSMIGTTGGNGSSVPGGNSNGGGLAGFSPGRLPGQFHFGGGGSPFNPNVLKHGGVLPMFSSSVGGLCGPSFPSPNNQLLNNLNLMLPSSNSASPNNHMMLASGHGSRLPSLVNSGNNSVVMSPTILSPTAAAAQAAQQNMNGQINTHAIQQQIMHLQNMLQQQQQQQQQPSGSGKSANGTNKQPSPNGNTQFGSPSSYLTNNQQLTPQPPQLHQSLNQLHRPKFDFSSVSSASFNHAPPFHPPAHVGINSPPNFMSTFGLSGAIAHTPDHQLGMSTAMPPMSPLSSPGSSSHGSGSENGGTLSGGTSSTASTVQYAIKLEEPTTHLQQQFPLSPVLPVNMRLRDRTNNGLYHSFDSNPDSANVSVHSSLTSLPPDTTSDASSTDSSAHSSLRNSTETLAQGLASQSLYPPRTQSATQLANNNTHMRYTNGDAIANAMRHGSDGKGIAHHHIGQPSEGAIADAFKSTHPHPHQHQHQGISSVFWNPTNPHAPNQVTSGVHSSLPSVNSPDFLCSDLFQRGGSDVPAGFFNSPLVDSGSSSGSANSSPLLPLGCTRSASLTSSSALSAAMKVPAQVIGSGDLTRSPSEQSHQSNNHKRKKRSTKNKKRRHGSSSTPVDVRRLYSLSPKMWNLQEKRPPFRSTLTIGKHTDKFKSTDVIQVRFGGTFLDQSQIDQYKKHLIIDVPPPPTPTALHAASQPVDLTHTHIEVDLELHRNGQHVFTTIFTYKFGGSATELTTSSSSDDDSSEDGSDDESGGSDSMHDGSTGSSNGGSTARSPDRDRDAGGAAKRHKSWMGDDASFGGSGGAGRTHAHGPPDSPPPPVRISVNLASIPIFSRGVLKSYPLLNAGLQDLLQNYLLHECMAQQQATDAQSGAEMGSPKRRYTAHKAKTPRSPPPATSNATNDPEDPASALAFRAACGVSQTAARVAARMRFVQALTGPDPMAFVHTALSACVNAAAGLDEKRLPTMPHATVHAIDSFGFALLHYTVSVGDIALTQQLLSLHASPHQKARNKHSMYAFTPAQLVELRAAEEEKAEAKRQRAAANATTAIPTGAADAADRKKKRRTSIGCDGSASSVSSGSCVDDAALSSDSPSDPLLLLCSNVTTATNSAHPSPLIDTHHAPFAAQFASRTASPVQSVENTPTAQGKALFKAHRHTPSGSKAFHFGRDEMNKAASPLRAPLMHDHMHVYHLHHGTAVAPSLSFDKGLVSSCGGVSPAATTAAGSPASSQMPSMLSSPTFHSTGVRPTHTFAPAVSMPSTPINATRTLTLTVKAVNERLTQLFMGHTAAAAADDSNAMCDQPAAAPPAPAPTASSAGLLHISAQLESYLAMRWSQAQQRQLAFSMAAQSQSPRLTVTDAQKANQRDLVMLELASLIQHAQKQMQSLDLDLPESAQASAAAIPANGHMSSPVQSLHIHTLRELLSQFHILLKYYTSFQKHRFEQEQMKSLVADIDHVALAPNAAMIDATAQAKSTTQTDMADVATEARSAVTNDDDESASPPLSDLAIHALLAHVSSIELQLRAHILHMQHCLEPFITRALDSRRQKKEHAKEAKLAAAAALVASAVNANYAASTPHSTRSLTSDAPPPILSAGHLSRTHSGQLSLNIVGSFHPDEDDDCQRIEVREIHGVDVVNSCRIDLQLNSQLVAEETQAEAERKLLRRLHGQTRSFSQQPQLDLLVEQAVTSTAAATAAEPHAATRSTLAVAPFSTPAASPMARAGPNHFTYAHEKPHPAIEAVVAPSESTQPTVAASEPRGNKYALLIGINQYSPALHIPPLLGCENDVARISSIIHRSYGFDLAQCRAVDDGTDVNFSSASKTHALLNSGATRFAIRRALISLVAAVTSPADTVLIYFAGHGFAECLIAFDGMLDYSELTFLLESIQTRDVSFVSDTCATSSIDSSVVGNGSVSVVGGGEVRNTTLTLAEMVRLVESRDLFAQQQTAAQILATISPNAPGIQHTDEVTRNDATGSPDERKSIDAMEEWPEAHIASDVDDDDDDGDDEDDPDEDASSDSTPMDESDAAPVTRRYRGLAFLKADPLDPTSPPVAPVESPAPVMPVIRRLFGGGVSSGHGYFARGAVSKDDLRAAEVQVEGKWHGAYTARICAKLEAFSLATHATGTYEPANPGVITLASILFHDEDGGNLSCREASSAGSSRKSSVSLVGGEVPPFDWPTGGIIDAHQTDEIDPQLLGIEPTDETQFDEPVEELRFETDIDTDSESDDPTQHIDEPDLSDSSSSSESESESDYDASGGDGGGVVRVVESTPIVTDSAGIANSAYSASEPDESDEFIDAAIPDDTLPNQTATQTNALIAFFMTLFTILLSRTRTLLSPSPSPSSPACLRVCPARVPSLGVSHRLAALGVKSSPVTHATHAASAKSIMQQQTADFLTTEASSASAAEESQYTGMRCGGRSDSDSDAEMTHAKRMRTLTSFASVKA